MKKKSKKQVQNRYLGRPKERNGFKSKKPKGPTTPEKRKIKADLPEENREKRKLKRLRLPNEAGMRKAFRDPSKDRPKGVQITFGGSASSIYSCKIDSH